MYEHGDHLAQLNTSQISSLSHLVRSITLNHNQMCGAVLETRNVSEITKDIPTQINNYLPLYVLDQDYIP